MFLMNQWYAAALPSELSDKPLARTVVLSYEDASSITPRLPNPLTPETERLGARRAVRHPVLS
jgi:hypothetical protein